MASCIIEYVRRGNSFFEKFEYAALLRKSQLNGQDIYFHISQVAEHQLRSISAKSGKADKLIFFKTIEGVETRHMKCDLDLFKMNALV